MDERGTDIFLRGILFAKAAVDVHGMGFALMASSLVLSMYSVACRCGVVEVEEPVEVELPGMFLPKLLCPVCSSQA